VRRRNFAFQKRLTEASWKAARRIRGQHTEEGAARRHPWQRSLQHPNEQAALAQLAHDQGGEGPVHGEIGAEQNAADVEAGVEKITPSSRWNVEHRNRVADERQGSPNALMALLAHIDRQVASLAPRRRPQRGQVHRESLLQFPRPTRRDQSRTRWATADVDQETRSIGLRAGTRECGGRCS
jgi:hypothetical protein